MVSSTDIITYIEERYADICERPHMHALDPESLEEVLVSLDDIREFALTGLPCSSPIRRRYASFLRKVNCGSASYIARRRSDAAEAIDNNVLFIELSWFWKRFRDSADYMTPMNAALPADASIGEGSSVPPGGGGS